MADIAQPAPRLTSQAGSADQPALSSEGCGRIFPGMASYIVKPEPLDPRLTRRVAGLDQDGRAIETDVVVERPLTLFLNGQEIVTMMTVGDHPDCLAVGYLLNQNMLKPEDELEGIEHDEELGVVVVRTARKTDYEKKLRK